MSDNGKRGVRDWRSFLSDDEREELRKIDEETSQIDKRRRHLTHKRRLIVDRAGRRSVCAKDRPARAGLLNADELEKVASEADQ